MESRMSQRIAQREMSYTKDSKQGPSMTKRSRIELKKRVARADGPLKVSEGQPNQTMRRRIASVLHDRRREVSKKQEVIEMSTSRSKDICQGEEMSNSRKHSAHRNV